MKHKLQYKFLPIWGALMSIGSIEQLIYPSPTITINLFKSPILISIMLAVGLALILSFILLNKNVRLGKTLSVVALSINICYYIMAMIFLLLNIATHTGEMIFGLFIGIVMILVFIRYIYVIVKE
jgi:hypothetical protein